MDAQQDAVAAVVGLGRALRAAGVSASPDRVQQAVRAVAMLDPNRREDVYWAARLTLCASAADIARFDRVFDAYFGGGVPAPRNRVKDRRRSPRPSMLSSGTTDAPDGGEDEQAPATASTASRTEVLRQRDLARLTAAERDEVAVLLRRFRLPGEPRRTRRRAPAHRGRLDAARTTRELLRRGGEPSRLHRSRRRHRPRPVVLLVDVSGSMSPYASALLRFAHAAATRRGDTEVFTFGTRLTRVTRELSHHDPDVALKAVSRAVPDLSGGTRLGDMLKAFLDRWGQPGLARGAVVVILSDGWERGGVEQLATQMARLSRLAHRVVWANPLKGQAGYEPLAAGMAAALPWVDAFVSGHSLAALERLADVVQGEEVAHA